MHPRLKLALLASAAALGACSPMASTSQNPMSFFVTSANPGKGADFGGLAGADAYCQRLASSANAGNKNWRAYLSTTDSGGSPAVNARDRIGRGPWQNAKGVVVATGVDNLHGPENKLNKQNSLTEKGEGISGRGDPVNMHDILTGSRPDGTAVPVEPGKDTTCGNWTSSGAGSAIVGHHDRDGTNPDPVANVSWNSSHGTPGCGMDALKSVGGAGLLYCFAEN
ncbi:MAG: hypothetical protein ABIV07_14765 [Polaromonas sp.]